MSKLLVSCDHYAFHYNGKYYLKESGITLLNRYLIVFNEIRFAVRVKYVKTKEELGIHSFEIIDNRIEVYDLPFFQGPKQYLKVYSRTRKNIKNVTNECGFAIFRLPSTVGFKILKEVKKNNIPYAIEVIANPDEISKLTKSKINYILLRIIHYKLKRDVKLANGVSYVTKSTLQNTYPISNDKQFESYYSSVELPEKFYYKPRTLKPDKDFVLCHVSNQIKSHNKGYITAIQTLKILKSKGYDNVRLKFAGYGDLVPELIEYCQNSGVNNSVEFVGHLKFDELRDFLLTADLMVFPTVSEGLPRCIIEAGATGLPCISSPVGGIPELLPEKLLFPPDQPEKYAESVISMINKNCIYTEISKNLYELSKEFSSDILTEKRTEFYNKLKNYQK